MPILLIVKALIAVHNVAFSTLCFIFSCSTQQKKEEGIIYFQSER